MVYERTLSVVQSKASGQTVVSMLSSELPSEGDQLEVELLHCKVFIRHPGLRCCTCFGNAELEFGLFIANLTVLLAELLICFVG